MKCVVPTLATSKNKCYYLYIPCATSWKFAGSVLDGVIGSFHWHNTSDSTVNLGSTQHLTTMSTTGISWG